MAVAAIGLLATGAFAFNWFAPDRIPPAASSQPFEAQGDTFNELTTSSISRAPLLQAKLVSSDGRITGLQWSQSQGAGRLPWRCPKQASRPRGWQMAALFDKDVWECGSGFTPVGDAPDGSDESNLFLMLRGSSDGTIQNLHLKLNLLDPKDGPGGARPRTEAVPCARDLRRPLDSESRRGGGVAAAADEPQNRPTGPIVSRPR